MPVPGERVDIVFDSGIKGYLTVAGCGTEKLSFFDIIVSGKRIFCEKSKRNEFIDYLCMIDRDTVDVTYMYSFDIAFPPSERRKSKKAPSPTRTTSDSVEYNCTVSLLKHHAVAMFDDKAERRDRFTSAVSKIMLKSWVDEQKSPITHAGQ
jgi:hypothetical protein